MWDWYTGILIWKTQNPWTSLRGKCMIGRLDVNASLYGTRKGCEPLHAYYNPVTRKAGLLNTTLKDYTDLSIVAVSIIWKANCFGRKRRERAPRRIRYRNYWISPFRKDQRCLFLTAGFECGRSQYLLADNRAERLHQLISTSEVKTGYQDRYQEGRLEFCGYSPSER